MTTTDDTALYKDGTRAYVSLTARHASAPASEVIALLGEPDKRAHNAGDVRAVHLGVAYFHTHSYCSYTTSEACISKWLGDHLRVLAERFPDPAQFATLHDRGWTFEAWCYIPVLGNVMHDLAPDTIAWLAAIHASIMLDVYSFADDSDESRDSITSATLRK